MSYLLQSWAAERGYAVAWGPASILEEAKAGISALGRSGALDPDFFQADLQELVAPQEHSPGLNVVMIAKPRPAHRVGFDFGASGGGRLEVRLPPTYLQYWTIFEEVRQDLTVKALVGARVELLQGPHKAVAARLGLVKYGRNNLAYAPGIGSYLQLCGYVTDAVLPSPGLPLEPEMLPECADCQKCRTACPTQAIGADRLLLRAQRCLTQANENPGPWPPWVPERAHHCLVGCLVCQRVCPANPRLTMEATGLEFSAEETKALSECPPDDFGHGLKEKLERLVAPYLWPVLGRNLKALAASSSSGAPARTGSSRA